MPYKPRTISPPSDPASLEAYALAYIEQLKTQHYAQQSVQYKYAALSGFIDWSHERGIDRIEQITRPVLQRYQRHLYYEISRSGKPLTIESQRHWLTALRTWFRFLMRENLILYNPASELELPKPEKRLPKHTLTAEEAELVLAQPDIDTDQGLLDRAILEVLYSTGVRRQEALNLCLQDINAGAGVLAIRQGKGKKDRFVPVSDRALQWLQKYIDDVRPLHRLPSSPDNVFLDKAGTALDPHKVGSCHLFRHTMATLMLEGGADIRFIQQMLGHSAITTTEIYTHVAIHKLKEVHRVTHPGQQVQSGRDRLLACLSEEGEEEYGETR